MFYHFYVKYHKQQIYLLFMDAPEYISAHKSTAHTSMQYKFPYIYQLKQNYD